MVVKLAPIIQLVHDVKFATAHFKLGEGLGLTEIQPSLFLQIKGVSYEGIGSSLEEGARFGDISQETLKAVATDSGTIIVYMKKIGDQESTTLYLPDGRMEDFGTKTVYTWKGSQEEL